MTRLKKILKWLLIAGTGTLILAAAVIYLQIAYEADRVLEEERNRIEPSVFRAEVKEIGPLDRSRKEGWKIIATGRSVRDVEWFEDRLWAATSGGLLAVSPDGKNHALYTRLNGLPDADITCLAQSEGKLFAGTATGSLLIVKGGRLSVAASPEKPLGRITALMPLPGAVLIGTGESGVYLYDGRSFTDIGRGRAGADFRRITSLAMRDKNLIVGTFDSGVFIEEPAGFSHFTEEQGLPMNQVTALLVDGADIYAGTPMGWAIIDERGVTASAEGPFVTSLSRGPGAYSSEVWVGSRAGIATRTDEGMKMVAPENINITAMKLSGGVLYAGAEGGAYSHDGEKWTPLFLPGENEINANHVTAILPRGNELWVGTFENGFRILDPAGAVKTVPADDAAWAINGFLPDGDTVWVAHNAGISAYKGGLPVRHLRKKDGLIGERVSAACAAPGGRAYATEAGITFDAGGPLKSIYAFHGLANNHVYACASTAERTYVGTLGGLNAMENLKVIKTWRPGESPLKAGWITALAVSGEDLFIGTYGGGVQKLSADGKWTDYADSIGKFEVNPGAMLLTGCCLLVGSLDRGLFIMKLDGEKWENITDGLASLNVTSTAVDAAYYYIGTDRGITVIPRGEIEGKR